MIRPRDHRQRQIADVLARYGLDYLANVVGLERLIARERALRRPEPRDRQIPRVFWDLTTSRVITLERIRRMKVTDSAALNEAGLDRHDLAQRAAQIVAKMVFEDGFFHADPHPGNFFIEPGGRIGIVDFGMVGTLDDALREQLSRLLTGFLRQDADRLADAVLALGTSTEPVDRARLREDLAGLLARLVAVLDPDFRFAEALEPYARRQLLAQLTPSALRQRVEQFGIDVAELAVDFPGRLDRLLRSVESGGLEVRLRTDELEALLARAERVGNRVAASVLAAAVIDGLGGFAVERRRHRPSSRTPWLGAELGALATAAGYMAWRRWGRR